MYANLFFTIALATSFGPVVPENDTKVAPNRNKVISQSLERVAREAHDLIDAGDAASKRILSEVERHLKSAATQQLKKLKVKLIALQQEEEEVERDEARRDRDRERRPETLREQVEQARRRASDTMEEFRRRMDRGREGQARREREPREQDRERVEIEIRERRREQGPPPGLGPIERQLREQAERIERLEGEVRRLHGEVERLNPRDGTERAPMGIDVGRPQRLGALIERRGRNRDVGSNPEARVRALEQALAELKARAQGREAETKREAARAAAQRKEMEEARRRQIEAMRIHLDALRVKRAQVRRKHEEKKAAVKKKAEETIAQIEIGFKKMDRELERSIAEFERRLAQLGNQDERERD